MTKATRNRIQMACTVLVLATAMIVAALPSQSQARVVVTGNAEIRVWVEQSSDVFASYDQVVVSFLAARDCYATVFMVDTYGFVHVVYPFAPSARAWVRGGRIYRYTAHELGLDALSGQGVAYVFVVGSPRPFNYARWGEGVFAGRFGLRVYGDPYVASREFYVSLLPGRMDLGRVSVSCTRFYVGEWVRFPSYLCHGHYGIHVRVGDYCRTCSRVYDGYRLHMAAPAEILHPHAKTKNSEHFALIEATSVKVRNAAIRRGTVATRSIDAPHGWTVAKTRVVSTSRTVSESKRNYKANYGIKSERGAAELARAHRTEKTKVSSEKQRVTKQHPSMSPESKPTKRAAKTKVASKRDKEGEAGSASKKAR